MSEPDYIPTPSQIEAACRKIWKAWSEREERARRGVYIEGDEPIKKWTVPEVVDPRVDG